ncbi:MAG: type II toxin-antitoxin system Phd/YefM family antitoxin [Nonomuraea sp.]|nr:type II toxin-antitoxin system Phd/YefM family antitoxin [Nonomuraea sp.]
MKPAEVMTVSDARASLSRILADFHDAGSTADPVFIGAHRKAEGVLLSVENYEELQALRERFERAEAVASAWGSVTAEGLVPTPGSAHDTDDYIAGKIDADELLRRALNRHQR